MTDYIKKLLLSAALGLVLVSPTFAQNKKCEISTKAEAQETIAKVPGLQSRPLTDGEKASIVNKLGPPPNLVEGSEWDGELVYNDMLAGVNIYQNDCFINKLGPAMKSAIFNILGIVEARGEQL